MKEGLKDENGKGQLAFEPDGLFWGVLTTTHLIAEMAAVSILHVEEIPPLYHRSSEVRGCLTSASENIYKQRCSEGSLRASQLRFEIGMNEKQRYYSRGRYTYRF